MNLQLLMTRFRFLFLLISSIPLALFSLIEPRQEHSQPHNGLLSYRIIPTTAATEEKKFQNGNCYLIWPTFMMFALHVRLYNRAAPTNTNWNVINNSEATKTRCKLVCKHPQHQSVDKHYLEMKRVSKCFIRSGLFICAVCVNVRGYLRFVRGAFQLTHHIEVSNTPYRLHMIDSYANCFDTFNNSTHRVKDIILSGLNVSICQ